MAAGFSARFKRFNFMPDSRETGEFDLVVWSIGLSGLTKQTRSTEQTE
jgi:hypothetical protein